MPRSPTATVIFYVLAVALLPSIAFWLTFVATCAIECSVLPWLSMIVGPGVAIVALIVMGVVAYKKAAGFAEADRRRVRFTVVSSLIFGWPLAFCVFGMSLPLAQKLGRATQSRPAFDPQFLASDLHFRIAGNHLVVPVFALKTPDRTFDLNRRRRDESTEHPLVESAQDPGNPASVDSLGLRIAAYDADYPKLREVCTLLARQWSRSLCLGARDGVIGRLPESFELLDRSKLDLLKHHWTVGKESRYDQVKDFEFQAGMTEIGCDKDSIFCTAAVEVQPGLLAVWTVWGDEKSGMTARAMADAQGGAIRELVTRGLGSAEDLSFPDAR